MTNTQEKQMYLNGQPGILGPPAPCSVSMDDFHSIFPDEMRAERWLENLRWPTGIVCHRCGSDRFSETESENRSGVVPYWCYYCRKRFSVRTGTRIQDTNIPLRKLAQAVYMSVNGPISSRDLSGYLGTSRSTALNTLKRIREAWGDPEALNALEAEIDETYFGKGRGTAGKIIVLGMKDRHTGKIAAIVISKADLPTIESYVELHMYDNQGTLYSDGLPVYREVKCVANHEYVIHSNGEYVNGKAHTNGLESFWSTLKQAYHFIYRHNISKKYFPLYVNEMVGRHNIRDMDTMEKMEWLASRLVAKK